MGGAGPEPVGGAGSTVVIGLPAGPVAMMVVLDEGTGNPGGITKVDSGTATAEPGAVLG